MTDPNALDGSTQSQLDKLFSDFDPAAWPVIAESNQGLIVHVTAKPLNLAVKVPRGRGLMWHARRLSLLREHAAYQRLTGITGLPRCFGLFNGCHLALEYIQGLPLRQAVVPDQYTFYDRLRGILEAMHRRGVAHGDLKSRQNIMMTNSGEPVIVDLGTAVIRKNGWQPFNHWLFNYLCRIDFNGWVKHKYGSYDNIADHDRHHLRRTRIERINNWVRRRII